MRAAYRVQQGLAHLTARVRPAEISLASRYLSPGEMALFRGMGPADQRHGLRVLRSLLDLDVTDENLLKAGLLHDVGKSRCRISVLHRTVAVLTRSLLGRLPAFIVPLPKSGWWMPFYVLANHPRIGAGMLAAAGSPERVWRLAELHQLEPKSIGEIPDRDWVREALATLRRVDDEN